MFIDSGDNNKNAPDHFHWKKRILDDTHIQITNIHNRLNVIGMWASETMTLQLLIIKAIDFFHLNESHSHNENVIDE